MGDNSRPGMGFEVNIRKSSRQKTTVDTHADTPFCMVVLGDFVGRDRTSQKNKPLEQRKPIAIDRDNFDDVLAGFKLSLTISPIENSGNEITIDINDLDDFHPDSLYEKLDVFSKLRGIRRRLKNNHSFDEAAREIMGWLVTDEIPGPGVGASEQTKNEAAEAVSASDLLENVLDSTHQSSNDLESITSPGGIDQLVKEIIAPYVEPAANPRQQEMIDAVDQATAGHMRQILHHPDFQHLEAAWRSIYFLISRIDTGRNLKIYLLDATREEIQQDLEFDSGASALHKRFCEPALNDTSWSLIVGNYQFEDTIEDALFLAEIGSIAECAQAPFIAGAKATLAGCDSFSMYPDADDWCYELKPGVEQAWQILRENPVAQYVGLALPRFLLRLPYGKKSRPIDSFSFEELTSDVRANHEGFLWGNAAFIKAEQLARAFSEKHWQMNPGEAAQTNNLPMYYYDDEGESELMPCAEIYLTEKGGRKISEAGLISLWSVKNRDTLVSSDFNSLAADRTMLQGRWVAS